MLRHMETVTVSHVGGATGQAVATGKPKKKKTSPQAKASSGGSSIRTLSDFSDSGDTSCNRKRVAGRSGGGGGGGGAGGGGGKRRAVGALQLGSEEGIGQTFLAAVSSKKGATALHREDPTMAFFKAAAGSALLHHQEEVLANERFKAALAGSYEMRDSDSARRSDGSSSECLVRFKVGRSWKEETFEVLALPEVRGVVQAVLEKFREEPDETSMHLLKPFKMAHVSPRVFWNMVKLLGGDVSAGLQQLVPSADWSFLEEREKRRSDKAVENERQAAEARKLKEQRADQRRAKQRKASGTSAKDPSGSVEAATAGEAQEAAVEQEIEELEEQSVVAEEEEGEDEEEEEEPTDADGWEERGKRAMLADHEYDYACSCINKALLLRIEAVGDQNDLSLARPWYLHGSALLRRAQAMALQLTAAAPALSTPSSDAAGPNSEHIQSQIGRISSEWQSEWQLTGSAAIGRSVRRYFALFGTCDGVVVAWLPPSEADGSEDEALWRVVMNDGDVEDLNEEELDEAMVAYREERSLEQEVELLLEAAWEALEMAVALYARTSGCELEEAEAHERLADAALQNSQPERALEEYEAARSLLFTLKNSDRIREDEQRLADIEFYLGVAHLHGGNATKARQHYGQAASILRLRSANLQKEILERQIAELSNQVGGAAEEEIHSARSDSTAKEEIARIAALVDEIDSRRVALEASA